jgi:hypothetical protein
MLFLVIERLTTICIIQNHNLKSLCAPIENNMRIERDIIIVKHLLFQVENTL